MNMCDVKKIIINKGSVNVRGLVILYLFGLITSFVNVGAAQPDLIGVGKVVNCVLDVPDQVSANTLFEVKVLLDIHPEWYIYAPTGVNAAQGMIETTVKFLLPTGMVRVGKIKSPEPLYKDGHEVYKGKNVIMVQTLRISPSVKPGEYAVKGIITWQACSSQICLPPTTEEIVVLVNVR